MTTLTKKQEMTSKMPRKKDKHSAETTHSVNARITMQATGLLRADYKSVTHGVQEASRCWPLVRRAAIKVMKRKLKFSQKERDALYALELPIDCDQEELVKIIKQNKLNCDLRVKDLDPMHAIVLIDLIRNGDLELVGVMKNREGEML